VACYNATESESMEVRRYVKTWEEFVGLIFPSIRKRPVSLRKRIEGGMSG